MSNKIDAAPWFWKDFHKRGFFSHMHRARTLRKIPMPKFGGEGAWRSSALAQNLICIYPPYLNASMKVTTDHLTLLTTADKDDAKWWEENAPAGCASPFGTIAAAHALREVHTDAMAKGYSKGVTLPFVIATLREISYLALFGVFLVILPPAVPIIIDMGGGSLGWGWVIINAITCGVCANLTMHEYKRYL